MDTVIRAPQGPHQPVRSHRKVGIAAAAVTGLALVVGLVTTVALIRVDASETVASARAKHIAGDCAAANKTYTELGLIHQVVSNRLVEKARHEQKTCDLLLAAGGTQGDPAIDLLEKYLSRSDDLYPGAGTQRAQLLLEAARQDPGQAPPLVKAGFDQLAETLADHPGESEEVRQVAETHASETDKLSNCSAAALDAALDDALGSAPEQPDIAEPVGTAKTKAPGHLLGCARDQRSTSLTASNKTYSEFLSRYPQDASAAKAKSEQYAVGTKIQYHQVNQLLKNGSYCDSPKPYRGAKPWRGNGPHRMQVDGVDANKHRFPGSWLGGAANATLVVCVSGPTDGHVQNSCYYTPDDGGPGGYVTFKASRYKVVAYELRTGRPVARYTRDIGEPCPAYFTWTEYNSLGAVPGPPPSSRRSRPTSAQVRSMFDGLVDGPA